MVCNYAPPPAPALPGNAQRPICDDWDANHTYIEDCSNTSAPYNEPPGPPGPPAYYTQLPCRNLAAAPPHVKISHGALFTVCGYCADCTKTHPWHKQAIARMTKPPPAVAVYETKKWRGFWTRMCNVCEDRENRLYRQRRPVGGLIAPPAPPAAALMANYPRNTCTCRKTLEDDAVKRCAGHRRARWEWLRNAMPGAPPPPGSGEPQLYGALAQRAANMEWLRTTALHPTMAFAWPVQRGATVAGEVSRWRYPRWRLF